MKMADNGVKLSTHSKIPMPVNKNVSRIPIRTAFSKSSSRGSLIQKVPKQNVSILKPIVSKRRSPNFKDFDLVMAGSKPIVKKKYCLNNRNSTAKPLKQTALPKNYFKASKEVKPVPVISLQPASPEKENAPPKPTRTAVKTPKTPEPKEEQLTALQVQQRLNIPFEVSDHSLNQILKPDRASQFSPFKDQKKNHKSLGFNLDKFSHSRPSNVKHSLSTTKINPFRESGYAICKAVCELKKAHNDSPFRRGSVSSPFKDQKNHQPLSFNLKDIRKLSISRPSLVKHSSGATKLNPFRESGYAICKAVYELKKEQNDSPFRRGSVSSPFKKSQPDPYEVAMASLRRLNAAKTGGSPSVSIPKSSLNRSKDQPAKVERPLEDALKKTSLEWRSFNQDSTPPLPVCRQATFIISKTAPVAKQIKIDEAKTIYRPLRNLMCNSAFKEQKKRLTDISEHSEPEGGSTRSLTCSLTDLVPLEKSEDSGLLLSLNRIPSSSRDVLTYTTPALKQQSSSLSVKKFPAEHLHTPRPISFYGKKMADDLLFSVSSCIQPISSHLAPICTPLVMQSIARRNEEETLLSPMCVKLDFQDDDDSDEKTEKAVPENEDSWDRRFSLSVQHILTKGKLEELQADEECANIMTLQKVIQSCSRMLYNPVAKVLTEGDLMHFVPVIV